MKLVSEASDEALTELFLSPPSGLNVSLAEHVLRLLAAEYVRRGAPIEGMAREALSGPAVCPHGRSTSGTCGACDFGGDEVVLFSDPCPPVVFQPEYGATPAPTCPFLVVRCAAGRPCDSCRDRGFPGG